MVHSHKSYAGGIKACLCRHPESSLPMVGDANLVLPVFFSAMLFITILLLVVI